MVPGFLDTARSGRWTGSIAAASSSKRYSHTCLVCLQRHFRRFAWQLISLLVSPDIVCLQEVESNQYYSFFLPELQARGYGGLFRCDMKLQLIVLLLKQFVLKFHAYFPQQTQVPRTNDESGHCGRLRHLLPHVRFAVHGCQMCSHALLAPFCRSKYRHKEEHLIEYERLSTRYSSGCAAMLNRVMPKVFECVAAIIWALTPAAFSRTTLRCVPCWKTSRPTKISLSATCT